MNLTEEATWEEGIYQLELSDPVEGGEDGIANLQAQQLANRTLYLKNKSEMWDLFLADICRQALINGNFDFWQRNISKTNPTSGEYVADRWNVNFNHDGGTPPTLIHSRQELAAGEILGSNYFYRINSDDAGSGYGDNSYYTVAQPIENGTIQLCGEEKEVTVRFKARSSISGKKLGLYLMQGYGDGSPNSPDYIDGTNVELAETWEDYSHTFTTASLVDRTLGTVFTDYLSLNFLHQWGVNYAHLAGDTIAEGWGAGNIDIAQVQLSSGDTVLPFYGRHIQQELSLCQRYYEKSYSLDDPPGAATFAGDPYQQQNPLLNSAYSSLVYYSNYIYFNTRKRISSATVQIYSPDSGTEDKIYWWDTDLGAATDGEASVTLASAKFSHLKVRVDNPTVNNLFYEPAIAVGFHWTADAEL